MISLSLAAAIGTLALLRTASAQDEDGVIHACVNDTNGLLRVVEGPDDCRANEHSIAWSIGASQGPTGPSGPQGPAGPSGQDGTCDPDQCGGGGAGGSGGAGGAGGCAVDGAACTQNSDCCNATCNGGTCAGGPCRALGSRCGSHSECCSNNCPDFAFPGVNPVCGL
jgi:hypothetical protein